MKVELTVVIISIAVFVITTVLLFLGAKQAQYRKNDEWLVDEFSRCNVIVFGKKGIGKDLLFSHVIALRDESHYSNIVYDKNTEVVDVKDIAVGELTFLDLVEGSFEQVEPTFEERTDFYISDAGIYFPSQYDKQLDKIYPSMPILYALSRHLYASNIHCNTQNLGRVWLKLREQADCYIRTIRTKDKGEYLEVTAISYDKYESAARNLLPNLNKAENGEIVKRKFRIYKNTIKYDTRYFRRLIFKNVKKERLENLYERP